MNNTPEILTAEQAAGLLQFSVHYTRTLAMRGQIPAIKWGDDWRFVKQQMLDYLTQCATREQQSRKHEFSQQPDEKRITKKRGRPAKYV
jgi:excisionase family DNA binding protein